MSHPAALLTPFGKHLHTQYHEAEHNKDTLHLLPSAEAAYLHHRLSAVCPGEQGKISCNPVLFRCAQNQQRGWKPSAPHVGPQHLPSRSVEPSVLHKDMKLHLNSKCFIRCLLCIIYNKRYHTYSSFLT